MRRLSLTFVVLLLLISACGGNGDVGKPADAASVSITSPEDGATVPGTFQVAMEAEGFTVEPAGEVSDGAGHFHLIVDGDCVAPGEQIPADETHVHLEDGASETRLTLPAGRHTLCLQAGDGRHAALGLTDTITIDVGSAGESETTTTEGESIAAWRGSYEGEVVWDCGPAGTHRGTLEADVELLEWSSGEATLEVDHTVTGSCADTGQLETSFGVIGRRAGSGFTFPSDTWGVPGAFRLRIDGDRVEGRLSGPVPGPGQMTIVFDLECFRNC